jgi:hypothetical protein
VKNVSDKFVEKIKTHIILFLIPPPPPSENRAVYELMWKNVVDPDRTQMAI